MKRLYFYFLFCLFGVHELCMGVGFAFNIYQSKEGRGRVWWRLAGCGGVDWWQHRAWLRCTESEERERETEWEDGEREQRGRVREQEEERETVKGGATSRAQEEGERGEWGPATLERKGGERLGFEWFGREKNYSKVFFFP